MKRRIAAFLIVITALTFGSAGVARADNTTIQLFDSGDNVVLMQLRLQELGYYHYKVTGYFANFTKQALMDFQHENGITADGLAGQGTLTALFGNDAKKKPIEPRVTPKPTPKPTGKATAKPTKYGQYLDWFTQVNSMWKMNMHCKVVDLDTGISYIMVRVGGGNHADVAPATKADTAKFLQTYHGTWSWDRRAVVVYIGGTAVAGSTNGRPHGSTGIKGNGMLDLDDGSVGQVCIHFKNSRGHHHNVIDPAHQYEVKRAAGMKNLGPKPVLAGSDD